MPFGCSPMARSGDYIEEMGQKLACEILAAFSGKEGREIVDRDDANLLSLNELAGLVKACVLVIDGKRIVNVVRVAAHIRNRSQTRIVSQTFTGNKWRRGRG